MRDQRPKAKDVGLDYEEVERRVRRRVRRNLWYTLDTLIMVINVYLVTTPPYFHRDFFWFWTVLWVAHTIWFVYQTLVERAIRRELERERELALLRAETLRYQMGLSGEYDEERLSRLSGDGLYPDEDEAVGWATIIGKPKRKRPS